MPDKIYQTQQQYITIKKNKIQKIQASGRKKIPQRTTTRTIVLDLPDVKKKSRSVMLKVLVPNLHPRF